MVFLPSSERKGFLGAEYADFKGSLQQLTSSQLREQDKINVVKEPFCVWGCLERIPSWHGQEGRCFLPFFCGQKGRRWALILESVLFLSLLHVRELPEFASLMSLDRSKWPRCLLWHGWLHGLNGISLKDPWATSFGGLASCHLERCLGCLSGGLRWFLDSLLSIWDADDIALEMSDHPNSLD